jgi:hypothetical protein
VVAAAPRFPTRSDRQAQLSECRRHALGASGSDCEFVVPTAEVLHERVSGDDHLCVPISSQPTHRSEPMLESVVISLDRIVRMTLDVMPRHWDQFLEHSNIDRGGVGDDLNRGHLQRGQRPSQNLRAVAASRRAETSTSTTWPCWSIARYTYRQTLVPCQNYSYGL